MCDNPHRIVLNNVNTRANITTDLILIQGHVEHPCESGKLTIFTNTVMSHTQDPSVAEFKLLLALSAGLNDCIVSYCNTSVTLQLNHTPISIPYEVIPLYVICGGQEHFQSPDPKSRSTAQVACHRIDVMMQLVQLVYAEKLSEVGLGRRSFKIGGRCREYFSKLPLEEALEMSEQELWEALADEIIRTEGAEKVEKRKYMAIPAFTRFEGVPEGIEDEAESLSYDSIKRRTKARAAIGGGGLVVFNTGCLYAWPDTVAEVEKAFRNKQPVDMKRFADDSNYRRTLGGCFATNLGSLCHELGHTFDLGHTEEGIMGRSFDATEKLFLPAAAIENRILPKRSSPGRTSSNSSSTAAARITRVRMNGTVLRDYLKEKECNGIYFTRNCLAILDNHKWFRDNESMPEPCQGAKGPRAGGGAAAAVDKRKTERKEKPLLWFSATKQTVHGVHPLRLVELRELSSEMVKHFWELTPEQGGDEDDTEFKLPLAEQQCRSRPWILFAIDCRGNTLKCHN